jgi:polyferredoxin
VVLLTTLAASLFVERPWCKYACPLGALIGLIGHLSLIKVERNAASCNSCGLCDRRCPMKVKVSTAHRIGSVECNNCMICTEVCPTGVIQPSFLTLKGVRNEG